MYIHRNTDIYMNIHMHTDTKKHIHTLLVQFPWRTVISIFSVIVEMC